jgi:FADH2 O2-dependent halogenase
MTYDLLIVGSGFAGSLLAMIARRLGRSVLLLERERHPRFAIGESSTPLANLILETLAARYDLTAVAPLAKYGTWQRHCPHLACGLKRGFSFFHHNFDRAWSDDDARARQLLVGASPHDRVADTHWYRPDFDFHLAQCAQSMGADFLDHARLHTFDANDGAVEVAGQSDNGPFRARGRFLVDATGPRGFLHRQLKLPERPLAQLPRTQSLFSHFRRAGRWSEVAPMEANAPFPCDDAALHHVFPGGWIWVLRFNNGVTSAGVAAQYELANSLGLSEGAAGWNRLLTRLPSVAAQFRDAEPVEPFRFLPQLHYRSGRIAGPGWALLPSAAGFVDPLMSTGFTLTLLGVERWASMLEQDWGSSRFESRCREYAAATDEELETCAHLIAGLYAAMDDFDCFRDIAKLYFAAVSFTEAARRLGRPELAGRRMLLGERSEFGSVLRRCAALAGGGADARAELRDKVRGAIEPVDVAGLGRMDRQHWHPALADDLIAARDKVGATLDEVKTMLVRCGIET